MQFFSFSIRLSAFTEILSSSKSDIFFFLLMFVILVFGYAVTGYSLFGSQLRNYSTIFYSLIEQFKILSNYFDYKALEQAHPSLGPIFFVSFNIFFTLFLLNMFIAIIVAHYNEF